jgi:hypothetical protein
MMTVMLARSEDDGCDTELEADLGLTSLGSLAKMLKLGSWEAGPLGR